MKYTINDFHQEYPDDEACLEKIFQNRYGALSECPQCEKKTKFHRVLKRKCYACQNCGFQLHPTAGTIFDHSPTPLKMWFFAMFLFSASRNGVSAKELQRHLGVTYKCAYRMGQQIRKLMEQGGGDPLKGTVEADETYYGANTKKHIKGRGSENKTPIFGMVEREGNVIAKAVPNVKASTVMPLLRQNVEIGAKLMTDEYGIYNRAYQDFDHERVNHGRKEYVRGDAHTNTIEGFWGQLKRSIHGTYHFVSPRHLQRYIDEFAWRYNNRSNELPFFLLLKEQAMKRLA